MSALDAKFNDDELGASAYDPRVMLKIVLLAYSRGLISSRSIQRACQQNVVFMERSDTYIDWCTTSRRWPLV